MAVRTGVLAINSGVTRLDFTPLAVQGGQPNPIAAATNRVRNSGFKSGDRATVTGSDGTLDGVPVLFMVAIAPAMAAGMAMPAAAAVPRFELASAESAPNGVSPDLDPRLQWWLARRRAGENKAATASTTANEVAVIARVAPPAKWEELSEVRTPTLIGHAQRQGLHRHRADPDPADRTIRAQPFVKSLKAAQDSTAIDATTEETGAGRRPAPAGTSRLAVRGSSSASSTTGATSPIRISSRGRRHPPACAVGSGLPHHGVQPLRLRPGVLDAGLNLALQNRIPTPRCPTTRPLRRQSRPRRTRHARDGHRGRQRTRQRRPGLAPRRI